MGVEGAPPPATYPLVIAEQTPEPDGRSVAAALGACAAAQPASVVAWHGLMNAQPPSHVLLRDGVADPAAPATHAASATRPAGSTPTRCAPRSPT